MLEQFIQKNNARKGLTQMVQSPSGQLYPKLPNFHVNPANGNVDPAFPGERAGLTLEDVKSYNNEYALKTKGFNIDLVANKVNSFDPEISGTAWCMLGIIVHANTNFANDILMPLSLSVLVNEEKVNDSHQWTTLEVKYMTNMFFPFERFLAGRDQIRFDIDNTGKLAQNVSVTIYYK